MLSPDEIKGLEIAFERTLTLFKKHKNSESWSDNIIHGSVGLKTQEQWTQYQAWLANPKTYDLSNPTKAVDIIETALEIPKYPDNMVVNEFQNGNETIVNVVNTELFCDEKEEDEKSPQ